MLSFATEFPVRQTHDSRACLRAVGTWILGSPYTVLEPQDVQPVLDFSEPIAQRGQERFEALAASDEMGEACGVRYSRRDANLDWNTTVTFSRGPSDAWAAIQVACESRHPALRLPPAKKPVLVRTLLESLGGAKDGPLAVGKTCVRLANTDIDLAAALLRGTAGCHLPVVYLSAGFQGNSIVDPNRLARELAGMAHVVVEPNRPFSLRLKIEVESENVYGGTIGIYWPDGAGRRSFFLGREYGSPTELSQAIVEEVRTALTNRRGLERCSWARLKEVASRKAQADLRAAGSEELRQYIANFDQEVIAKQQRLDEAEREIDRLRNEVRIHEARRSAGAGALLDMGPEQDLYPHEIISIVRDALEDAITRVPADSRRQHVLRAIVEANPEADNLARAKREKLKELLRGTRSLDAKTRKGLEELGFSITNDGKHHKLVFQGDDRYTFPLPKSGSDWRGGLNAASDIGKRLF